MHAVRAAMKLQYVVTTADLMFRKIWDLTNVMLKWMWCGS